MHYVLCDSAAARIHALQSAANPCPREHGKGGGAESVNRLADDFAAFLQLRIANYKKDKGN